MTTTKGTTMTKTSYGDPMNSVKTPHHYGWDNATEQQKLAMKILEKTCASEAARAVGVTKRTIMRWSARFGVQSGWSPSGPSHGTAPVVSTGCRCEPCAAERKRLNDRAKVNRLLRQGRLAEAQAFEDSLDNHGKKFRS
jgi:hypothetical protein